METQDAVEFVRSNHRAVLSTFRRDGRPQLSPVLASVDSQGRVVVSVTEDRAKTRNARRDPRVAVVVTTDSFFGPWAQLEGAVEVLPLPDAMEPLMELYRSVAGEHPDWAEFRAAQHSERRCLLRLTVERASGRLA